MRFSAWLIAAALGSVTGLGTALAQGQVADKVVTTTVTGAATTVSAAANTSAQDGQADPALLDSVKAAFEKRFEGVEIEKVRTTPVPGLYEVQIGMDLVYVDADVNYVMQGSLIDARTRTDLTAMRIQKLSEVPFDTLPLELAVKQVKGDGSRKLAVFEDPNCGYCKQFHRSLKDIDNITVYTFLFPILSPDSVSKARDVWCASDSAAVWKDWMVNGKVPPAAQCDDNPVEQVMALGQQLMVRGTPAILFGDGSRVNGALPADELARRLDAMN